MASSTIVFGLFYAQFVIILSRRMYLFNKFWYMFTIFSVFVMFSEEELCNLCFSCHTKENYFQEYVIFIKALWYCNFSVSQFSNTCGGVSVSQNIQLISFIFFKEMVIFAGRYSLYYQLLLSRNGTVRIWLLFRVNLLIYGEFPYQLNIALKSREVFMGSYQTMNP